MEPLWAYLDAGSGSMLLQLIVGGVAGAGVVARFYGRSLLNLVRKAPPPVKKPAEAKLDTHVSAR